MSGDGQRQLDTEALRIAVRAETMAVGTKESFLHFRQEVHDDLQGIRQDMKAQHGEIQGHLRALESALLSKSDGQMAKWFKVAGAAIVGLLGAIGWLVANGRPWGDG